MNRNKVMDNNKEQMPAPPCPFMGTVTVPTESKTLEGGTGLQLTTWPCNPKCPVFITVYEEEKRGDCAFKVMGNFTLMAFDVLKMAEDILFHYGTNSGAIDPSDFEEEKDEDDGGGEEKTPEPKPDLTPVSSEA